MIEPIFEESKIYYSLRLSYNSSNDYVRVINLASWFGFEKIGITEGIVKLCFKTQEEAILFKQMVDDEITPWFFPIIALYIVGKTYCLA